MKRSRNDEVEEDRVRRRTGEGGGLSEEVD